MPVFGAVLNLGCPLQYMYVLADALLYNAFVFYDNCEWIFSHLCLHPLSSCALWLLSLSCSSPLLFGGANCF